MLDDAPQVGRPVDCDQIMILIQNNESYTMQEMTDALKISKSSCENQVCQLGHINCFDVWVPCMLSRKKKKTFFHCISTCDSLLKCKENVPFLKQIVMGM